MAKWICVLIAAVVCAAAQTVEGTVSNVVTGGGIAGAKVAIRQDENAAYSATTDAEGRFRIEGVKEGVYSVRYSADRYFYPGGPAGTCDGTSNGPSRFEITGVPPGEYYALAVPGYELWPGNVDSALLRRATRLSVRAGETTQAELSLSTVR